MEMTQVQSDEISFGAAVSESVPAKLPRDSTAQFERSSCQFQMTSRCPFTQLPMLQVGLIDKEADQRCIITLIKRDVWIVSR